MRAMEYSASFFLLGLLALMPGIDCKDISVHEEKDYHMGKGLSDFLSESKDDHSRSHGQGTMENQRGPHHKHHADSDRDKEKVYLHEQKDIKVDGRPVHHVERDFLVEDRPSFSSSRDQRMRSASLRSDKETDQLVLERAIRREKIRQEEEEEEEAHQAARERSLRRDKKLTLTDSEDDEKIEKQLARERTIRREKRILREEEEADQLARERSLRRDKKVLLELEEEADELARERVARREKVLLDLEEEADQLIRERSLRRDKMMTSLSEDDDILSRLTRDLSTSPKHKSHRRGSCEELVSRRRSRSDSEMDIDELIRELQDSHHKDCPYLNGDKLRVPTKDNVKLIIVKESCESPRSVREHASRSCPQSDCHSHTASQEMVACISQCDKKKCTVEEKDNEIMEEVKVTVQKGLRSSSPLKTSRRSSSKSKISHSSKKSVTKKQEKGKKQQHKSKNGKGQKGKGSRK